MQPMNYTIQTGDAGEAFTQGMNRTAGMMATVADYQKSQAIATAAQQKAEADAYKRQRFMQVAQNPSSKDVQGLLLEFPELHEGIGKSLDFMSAEEKKNTQAMSFSVLSALEKGNSDVAIGVIDRQIDAAKQSKNEEQAQRLEMLRDSVVSNPDGARFGLKGLLFSTMGKDYGDLMKNLGENEREAELHPALVEKGKAEASETASKAVTAAAKAKFAESDAAIDLQKKGWDITKIQEDIKINKMNSQIAAMNAQTSRMSAGTAAQGNSLKAQENQIKLADLIDKRNAAVREKAADATASLATIDTSRALINEILGDEDTLRAASGVSAFRGMIPGTKSRAMAGKVDQLANSIASTKLELLKGATSDKDIQFLKTIDSNLDRYQNEDALVKEVKRIDKGLLEFRKRQADRYGVPNNAPISSSEPSSGKNTDAILKELGVIK